MYEKSTPGQKIGLTLGFKLRAIGGIEGILGHQNAGGVEIFTPRELETMRTITSTARIRARTTFNEDFSKLPSKGNGK